MEEIKEIKKVERTNDGTDNTDIDAILGIFPKTTTTDAHADHRQEEVEYVDNPAECQQVGRKLKKSEVKTNPITTKSIKQAKRVASVIVFWICIASAICITASIMLGAWVMFKPTGLLFTAIMVILAMGITLLFTQLYACVKEAIDSSC